MKSPVFPAPCLEILESRIAPAAVFRYTDVDGDKVTLTSSTGVDADLGNAAHVGGGQLQLLDLQTAMFGNEFRDADLTFSVVKAAGGDGLAHVGFINATGVDLGKVTIKGDLARIVAGDATVVDDPGLKALSVRSLGVLGLATGATSLSSKITGQLGTLVVAKDFSEAFLEIAGGGIGSVKVGGDFTGGRLANTGSISSAGAIGSLTIGGHLVGGQGNTSGSVYSGDSIGAVKVGGSIVGGGSGSSGQVSAAKSIGPVAIGGSVLGGSGAESGGVFAGTTLGLVKVKGSVLGASGANSGRISSIGALAGVQIGGDLAGGSNSGAGAISSNATLGPVKIGGNLIGGKPEFDGVLAGAGSIFASGRITSIAIRGSMLSAYYIGAGATAFCGSIRCGADIGSLSVGRGIFGNEQAPIIISAAGQAVKPMTGEDVAIGKITIKGDVRFAQILAGFNTALGSFNADASIGPVNVSGDWVASSLVAGAQDAGAMGFGAGDTLQSVGDTALVARIASITISGDVTGSATVGDQFGFVAQQIDKLSIGGRAALLTTGKSNNAFPIAFTTDVAVLEV